ncbi:4-alpha-glucanotransferase [Noviherbaspirillum humi]|uniref:4-alpha-glucanotransferase n=1 Tax=Noviherbaspirillum humi TaxID=1688639 RepID=A0A239FB51_9BURK|nr:4-alpha-glucanotransferase [Noviherbaspirillum humi]SNS54047.1 4-alpha-glucanotransferase [Noviherbaspirillum humi]
MNDNHLFDLAAAAGLSRDWTSAKGEAMQVSPDTLRTILEALELPCGSDEQCRDSRARLAQLMAGDALPPLLTGLVDQPLHLPAMPHLAGRNYRIEFEHGGQFDGRFGDDAANLLLPPFGQPGYHRLLVEEEATVLAIAPPRCYGVADAMQAAKVSGVLGAPDDPRLWGLGVQLYSLRRPGDGGLADYGALARLAKCAAERGAGALAISPVHAMFSADVHRFSPYGPSSRLFLNALHIDPASVLGLQALEAAVDALGPEARATMARLEQQDLVDWPQAGGLRLRLLRRLYEQFIGNGKLDEFDDFRAHGGTALRDHARFEALHAARLARGEDGYWLTWPQGLRDPAGAEVDAFAREHADEIRFHEFLQWQAARGLGAAQKAACQAGMPIGLISDLAVGADNGGSQAWSRQREIIRGLSVGAPPDIMNVHGQAWGLGAFSPHAMRAGGFAAYLEMLRASFAHAGGVRIDHVLGLTRLWLVPNGASPQDGAYLTYPLQDLLRLIALESWRHKAIVIGEDLGTVPEGFDRTLADAGLLGIRVLMFQRQGERFLNPVEWPRTAIATTTTHDLPTMAGWWAGHDVALRGGLGLLEPGKSEADARAERGRELRSLWDALCGTGSAQGEMPPFTAEAAPVDAAIDFMSAAPAPLAMLPIEDALGLTEQPNLPGTVDEHPNWRRRLPQPVEQVLDGEAVSRRLHILERTRGHRKNPG